MAFPVVESRASGRDAGNVTSHPITLPSGIEVGDLLLVVFSVDASETPTTTSEGWVRLAYQAYSTNVTGAIFYKIATGSDALSITTTTEEASHISFRISGAGTPTCSVATGSSTNSNPPNHTNPGGAEDVLWIVTRSGDAQVVATVAPASFSNLQTLAAATSGGASSNTAERSLNATSLDPGVFTSATEQWVSFTIAIPPGAVYQNLAGIISGIASVIGIVKSSRRIAGITAGVATVSGISKISKKIAGTIVCIGTTAGLVKVTKKIAGLISGIAAVAGDLTVVGGGVIEYLAGVVSGVASVTGAIKCLKPIAGLTAGISSVSGIAKISKKLSGVIGGIANVTGLTKVSRKLAGIVSSIAAVSGATKILKKLAGVSTCLATVSGITKVSKKIAGVIAGVASVAGELTITAGEILLAGVVSGIANVTGAIKISKQLTGTVACTGTITGLVRIAKKVIGIINGITSVIGNLTVGTTVPGVAWVDIVAYGDEVSIEAIDGD